MKRGAQVFALVVLLSGAAWYAWSIWDSRVRTVEELEEYSLSLRVPPNVALLLRTPKFESLEGWPPQLVGYLYPTPLTAFRESDFRTPEAAASTYFQAMRAADHPRMTAAFLPTRRYEVSQHLRGDDQRIKSFYFFGSMADEMLLLGRVRAADNTSQVFVLVDFLKNAGERIGRYYFCTEYTQEGWFLGCQGDQAKSALLLPVISGFIEDPKSLERAP